MPPTSKRTPRKPKPTELDPPAAAAELRAWRERAGITQAELARRLCTVAPRISPYEHGQIRPAVETAVAIELVTGIRVRDWYPEIVEAVAAVPAAPKVEE